MIIPYYFMIAFGVILIIIYGKFYFHRHPGRDTANVRFGYLMACLLMAGTVFLAGLPLKTLVLIEESPTDSLTPNHRIIRFYGNPRVLSSNGKIWLQEYNFQQGKKYLLNQSPTRLIYYPVIYTQNSSLSGTDNKTVMVSFPDTTFIEPHCCVSIREVPDYWFCNPPDRIESNPSGLLERVWVYLFGAKNVEWSLNYNTIDLL